MAPKSQENEMAFKLASTNTSTGLDFSKLGMPKSAEEREAEYQAERARERAEHEAKREQFATKTLDLTLTEVSSHFTRMSDRIVRLYGTDTKGRPVRAEYFVPDCYDREVADSFIARLEEGASYRMRGYWKAETVNGTKHFTFRVQFVDRKAS
jgi:hypothetical protein